MIPSRLPGLLLGLILLTGLAACSRPTPAAAPGDDPAATEVLPPPSAPESGDGGGAADVSDAYPDPDEPTEAPTPSPGPTTAP